MQPLVALKRGLEVWPTGAVHGVEGVQVRDLVRAPQFPGEANRTENAGYFEWPQTGNIEEAPRDNHHDNYGVQLVGYFFPPVDALYRFYIAADDQAHLWLSTDENPVNRQLIAVEPQWNGVRDFTTSERRHVVDEGTDDERLVNASKYIELEAGKAYFISQGEPVNCWDWIDQLLACGGVAAVDKSISAGLASSVGGMLELFYRLLPLPGEPSMTRFLARQLSTSHYFNTDRARTELGYEPAVSTSEGLRRLTAHLQSTIKGNP